MERFALVELIVDPAAVFAVVEVAQDRDGFDDPPVFLDGLGELVLAADPWRRDTSDTGLGRLSYQMAWKLFSQASGGSTFHQLRHSALTHLGEEGVSAILLQAKSRHQDPRTLSRYAKPGIEAVAALTAEFDRGRRHRR